MKYKRSIDCNKPKGFSQRQHCNYGRTKTGNIINKRRGGGNKKRPRKENEIYNLYYIIYFITLSI